MSARRSFLSVLALFAATATACRCGEEPVVVTAADGVSIAPWAHPELYLDRLRALEVRRLLIPWTDPATDLATLRLAATGRDDLELIAGLDPARTEADEWNRPRAPAATLEDAIARASILGDALSGVHLDHQEVGLPDEDLPAYLDQTIAAIRARTDVPISYAIRRRSIPVQKIMEAGFPAPPAGTAIESLDSAEDVAAWVNAWAGVLAGRVDRVVVSGADGSVTDARAIELLKNKLGDATEVWATVDLISPVRDGMKRTPTARNRDEVTGALNVLRTRGVLGFAGGGEWFEPAALLGPEAATRAEPPEDADTNLEARAIDVERRLRRCCLRDGQIVAVYDHRFERDHADNLYQEDACWLTGLYTAAMSFQYAVTRDPDAAARAREGFDALHQLANTTPLKGEVVRNFTRVLYGLQPEPPPAGSETIKRWRRAEDRELYWVGDISVDQLSGWFAGMAAYHQLVATEDEKRVLAADVAAVLDLFLANDLSAIEYTGQKTTFGNLRSAPVLALAFFQIGFQLTGDVKYRTEFERLIDEEGMHFQIGTTLALYHQAGRFGSDHFYSSGFYPLVALEKDPARRAQLELGLEIFHTLKRRFGDAYADTVYGVFHPELDASRRAMTQLRNYRPEFLENAHYLAEAPPQGSSFTPIEARPAAELDFDYAPPGEAAIRGGLEHRFSGVGFLLSYWMARHHGLTSTR